MSNFHCILQPVSWLQGDSLFLTLCEMIRSQRVVTVAAPLHCGNSYINVDKTSFHAVLGRSPKVVRTLDSIQQLHAGLSKDLDF